MPYYYDVLVRDRMTKEEVCIASLVENLEVKKIIHFLDQYCADFEVVAYPVHFGKHERS